MFSLVVTMPLPKALIYSTSKKPGNTISKVLTNNQLSRLSEKGEITVQIDKVKMKIILDRTPFVDTYPVPITKEEYEKIEDRFRVKSDNYVFNHL